MTTEIATLRTAVRDFAASELVPRLEDLAADPVAAAELFGLMARRGWMGVRIPAVYGGVGGSNLARVVLLEELARFSGAAAGMVQASILGAAAVVYCGDEGLRGVWLPRWAAGECLPSIAVTEPGSGGNVLAMQSTARLVGDEWVISGRKVWVGNSHMAGVHVVVARTGPGSGGLSAFLVEADRPGCVLGEPGGLAGLGGFSCGEVVFDGCRVPVGNLVGEVGDGLKAAYAVSVLDGRLNLAALAVGVAQTAGDAAAVFVRAREIGGRPLASFPAVVRQVGVVRSLFLTARQVTHGAARLLDAGAVCDEELVNAKHVATVAARDAVAAAVDVCAARGCRADGVLALLGRDVQPLLYAAGTPEVQLRRLGEAALGVGREPWSQRLAGRLREIHPGCSAGEGR